MIKKLSAAVAALALVASPAVAAPNSAFVGPRIEVNAGFEDFQNARSPNDLVYGAAVGADVPLGNRFTLGAEATARNVFDGDGRELGGGVRLGYAFNETVLGFARVGYSNVDFRGRNADGLALGGGLNFALSSHTYLNTEYRYTDFDRGVGSHGGIVGFGLRF